MFSLARGQKKEGKSKKRDLFLVVTKLGNQLFMHICRRRRFCANIAGLSPPIVGISAML